MKFPFVLAARSSLPISTLQELVAYAKANPRKLNFGTSGRGGPPHLMAEMLQARAGIRMTACPLQRARGGADLGFLAGRSTRCSTILATRFPMSSQANSRPWVSRAKRASANCLTFPPSPKSTRLPGGQLVRSRRAAANAAHDAEKLSQAVAEAVSMTDVVERLRRYS